MSKLGLETITQALHLALVEDQEEATTSYNPIRQRLALNSLKWELLQPRVRTKALVQQYHSLESYEGEPASSSPLLLDESTPSLALNPSSERSQLLRVAFGSNALGHREIRIDIVTAVSVLVIFVKLLAIRSLLVFLVAAYFVVYAWLIVQSLLLMFHSREMSELDMASSIRATRLLDSALKESSKKWWTLYAGRNGWGVAWSFSLLLLLRL
jgi:hypothetical protein